MQSIFNPTSRVDEAYSDKTLVVGGDSGFYDHEKVADTQLQLLIEALRKQIRLLVRQWLGNCKIEFVDIVHCAGHGSVSVVT